MPIPRPAIPVALISLFALFALLALLAPNSVRLAAAHNAEKPATRAATQRAAGQQVAPGHFPCDGQTMAEAPCPPPPPPTLHRRVGTVLLGRERNSDNCVFFVRDRVRSLRYGLGTWKGKLAIINAHVPRRGDVAIIAVGGGPYRDVGHVAIIEQVTANTITILEANYYAGRVSRRTAIGINAGEAAALLGIAGYFRP